MNKKHVTMIPIMEIRIVNPRTRNTVTYENIKANIASVGLKKPITVHERELDVDGTRYDLVCGQGRLESFRDLGDTMIPAIVNDAPEDERYLMSLVENLARRRPSTAELLREIKRLIEQHDTPAIIAQKLGLDKSYINGIFRLLRHGEEDLIARVEQGRLPMDTAIKIATGKDTEIQRALEEAYDNGTLRGDRLRAVQQLITKRKGTTATTTNKRYATGADLVRAYEHHTQQQRALVRRSAVITQRLAVLASTMRQLFADEHFVTLLRAEGIRTLPDILRTLDGATPCQ